MKYYQLTIVFVLLLALFFGRFLITPQGIVSEIRAPDTVFSQWPRAQIYSTYPFSDKAELLINAGAAAGAEEMMAVMVEDKFLLGQITKVFDNYSVVRTIFDSNWRLPVRIGPQQIDALLEGGAAPRLTMVTKNKEFTTGQIVYSASKDFRYGAPLGLVKKIEDSPTTVFKEAELAVPYDFNDLREISVVR